MIGIAYSPAFVKRFGDCDPALRDEIKEKIFLFRNRKDHPRLHVHKLHGRLKDRYSFSVNYRLRIIFRWLTKNEVILLMLGDHGIYQ